MLITEICVHGLVLGWAHSKIAWGGSCRVTKWFGEGFLYFLFFFFSFPLKRAELIARPIKYL